MSEEANKQNDAPDLSPFHPVIVMVEILILSLLALGLSFIIFGHGFGRLTGIPICAIGVLCGLFGKYELSPAEPRMAGVVTVFDSIIEFDGKPVVVGGRVWIIPFIMGIIEVKMDNQDHDIPMTIVSGGKNPIPMPGNVTLTIRPRKTDIKDYIQAGNSKEKLAKQIDGPVIEETKDVVKGKNMSPLEISQGGKLISAELEGRVGNNLFQQHKLGIELVFVRSNFPMPKEMATEMYAAAAEEIQAHTELTDSRTITEMAREMQREDAIQYIQQFDGKSLKDLKPDEIKIVDREISQQGGLLDQKKVLPFEDYRSKAERRRLIREGKVTVIEGAGPHLSINNLK